MRTREEIAEVNASIENSIAGIRVSRAYTSGEHEEKKFEVHNQNFQKARAAAYKVMGPVSYTHLDVYKRQPLQRVTI